VRQLAALLEEPYPTTAARQAPVATRVESNVFSVCGAVPFELVPVGSRPVSPQGAFAAELPFAAFASTTAEPIV
jgi:hypothetical protein